MRGCSAHKCVMLQHGVPEGEEGLLGEAGAGGGHGEDEGRDAEGRVDRHEARPEGGRGGLTTQEQEEAEEADHELEANG